MRCPGRRGERAAEPIRTCEGHWRELVRRVRDDRERVAARACDVFGLRLRVRALVRRTGLSERDRWRSNAAAFFAEPDPLRDFGVFGASGGGDALFVAAELEQRLHAQALALELG
jgi:hypothetical protein